MPESTTIDVADDELTDVVADSEAAATPVRPAGLAWREWPSRLSIPQVIVALAVITWTWYFTKRSLDIHHALGTSSYDSGLYDQGIYLMSRFDAPFVTMMGRNLMGDHTSFVLLFLVPLYWIVPAAGTMFFTQSAVIAAGAIPVFLYGRRRLGSEWLALVGAATYLLHPAVGWANLENFHPDSFLGVFVGFAIYFALESKWRWYAVFVVLSLMVKEDASLVIVPLGLWVAMKRDRRIGLLTIFGSLAFMAVAMLLIMRSLIGVPTRNGWRIPFGGPRGVIDTAVTNPTDLVDHLRSDGRPWYIWQMTAPFAWLFARLPDVALISGLVLFTNVLSTFWYQYQIEYHYSLIAVPALAIGTIYAIGAIKDRDFQLPNGVGFSLPARGIAIAILAAVTMTTAYMWAPLPWARTELYYGDPDNDYAVTARELMEQIPPNASVAAHYRLTPHLAYRKEVYQFPTPFRLVLYGPDASLEGSRLGARAEGVEYIILPTSRDDRLVADWEAIEVAFDEVASNERWVLYVRDRSIPLPAGGTDIEP
ncbi:MAG: DUF2079 domain-containing protein [Ilumatobacteraceae bacterium]|nr:DUF2079 domain-containing protein [Ilumatobacteraceae bacterium]